MSQAGRALVALLAVATLGLGPAHPSPLPSAHRGAADRDADRVAPTDPGTRALG
ncbi:hypothetical protein G7085_01620 [Tessaracoccus sp. HDW20]|uniref:hypothetical protein n=1 Tax=Tessaracoccus coleopterorum TaxID=2714950 RepID=UPI0018D47573|nr:hypothetical protein [Tessaracoccus coleopterorum]NHB83829.1 hypothetical protein [Tessaracoccus coleopterorum]